MDVLSGLASAASLGASLLGGSGDSGPSNEDQFRQSLIHSEYGILKPLGTSKKSSLQVMSGKSLKGKTGLNQLKRLQAGTRKYKGKR